jgi:hypothetical protein
VARSASSTTRFSLLAVGAGIAFALTGCVTTQQKNARKALVAERTLASRKRVRVTERNRSVTVAKLSTVNAGHGGALIVRLRNVGSRPLTDLPISVGTVTGKGTRTLLNAGSDLGYYQTHVAAIGAHAAVTWLFIDRRHPIPRGKPFAIVGRATSPASTTVATLPELSVAAGRERGGTLRMTVMNRSEVPQYAFPVYALATKGGRLVAVGRATVPQVETQGQTNLDLRLLGDVSGATITGYALPTIFK